MNEKKISFISCVNNFHEYNMALRHIHSLHIPDGYEVETVAIKQAKSLTSGYNQAMRDNEAKYKVYLHQDVYILNRNFIYNTLELFRNYPNLGMLGVAGGKTLPNGVWWDSEEVYGSVYHTLHGKNKIDLLSFKEVTADYEKVQAIDGLLMMTQYDIQWREDLFTGWHFYDISQSLEFTKAGYEVGVPRQNTSWCFHDCGTVNLDDYEKNKAILINHYNDYIISKPARIPPNK